MKSASNIAVKYVVKNKELRAYEEEKIKNFSRGFLSMLEAFQIEVFSFLMATNEEKGNFGELVRIFDDYFDKFKLEKNRLSRALDICLDIGFFKAWWRGKSDSFHREFENEHEASKIFEEISENFKNGQIEKNIEIFERYD